MNTVLFEDTLDIRQLNVDGKKFERVNRLHCKSNDYDVDVVLGKILCVISFYSFYLSYRCQLRVI